MTISSPTFQRLQDGIKSVDDLRVRGPVNAALAWLSGDLVAQLNTEFDSLNATVASISASLSDINSRLNAISQSVSVQIASAISVYASTRAAFLVHKNGSDQTSISANPTPLTFSTEVIDIGGLFASNAWTPPAGTHRLTAQMRFRNTNGVTGEVLTASVLKNGSTERQFHTDRTSAGAEPTITICLIVSANGTDTFQAAGRKSGAGVGTIIGDADVTFFCGEAIS